MFSYSLVEEMILNSDWINKWGNCWRSFRVEVFDPERKDGFQSNELSVIIHAECDISSFDDWVSDFESQSEATVAELVKQYNQQHPFAKRISYLVV